MKKKKIGENYFINIFKTNLLILNLRNTIAITKKIGLNTLYGNILFINTNIFCNSSIEKIISNNNCYYLNGRWIPGLLTNILKMGFKIKNINNKLKIIQKQKRKLKKKNITKNIIRRKKYLLKLRLKFKGLYLYYKHFPFIIIPLTTKNAFFSITEASLLNIFSIGLINSDISPYPLTVALNINTKNITIIPTFAAIYSNIAFIGNVLRKSQIKIKKFKKRKKKKIKELKKFNKLQKKCYKNLKFVETICKMKIAIRIKSNKKVK